MAISVGEITGLEDSRYSITVRAINDAGSSEVIVTTMTRALEAGESSEIVINWSHPIEVSYLQLHLLLPLMRE